MLSCRMTTFKNEAIEIVERIGKTVRAKRKGDPGFRPDELTNTVLRQNWKTRERVSKKNLLVLRKLEKSLINENITGKN